MRVLQTALPPTGRSVATIAGATTSRRWRHWRAAVARHLAGHPTEPRPPDGGRQTDSRSSGGRPKLRRAHDRLDRPNVVSLLFYYFYSGNVRTCSQPRVRVSAVRLMCYVDATTVMVGWRFVGEEGGASDDVAAAVARRGRKGDFLCVVKTRFMRAVRIYFQRKQPAPDARNSNITYVSQNVNRPHWLLLCDVQNTIFATGCFVFFAYRFDHVNDSQQYGSNSPPLIKNQLK